MTVRRALVRSTVAFAVVAAALTTAIAVAPLASADPPGTVQATVDEATGSYIVGFCVSPGHPMLDSFRCSDGSTLQGVTSVSAGGSPSISLAAGNYTTALAAVGTVALSPDWPVTVTSSQTIGCSYTMTAAPVCGGTGIVVARAAEPSGTYLTGFCIGPAHPMSGSALCTDGSSVTGLTSIPAGGSVAIVLPALHYNAALANGSGPGLGPDGPVRVVAGRATFCTFTSTAAPVCSLDDGDSAATFPAAVGGGVVTIAAADSTYAITSVTNTGTPYSPTPPAGASLPVGVIGFTVTLPTAVTTADVRVILPAGSNPTSYFKLQTGAWRDFTSHTDIVGDTVTLHLIDGDAFDSDHMVNGVIVDPGFPSTGYRFDGFRPPIDAVKANAVKAGQTTPVKWKLTDATGQPVTNPTSVVSLLAPLCEGGDAVKVSPLTVQADGSWHVNWKSDKTYKGQCRMLTLSLNDGTVHVATFIFG